MKPKQKTLDTQQLYTETQQLIRGRKRRILTIFLVALMILVAGLGLWGSTLPPGCQFGHQEYRDEVFSITAAIYGERKHDVFVDLYRPNETQPLPVAKSDLEVFVGTDVPYIAQRYKVSLTQPGEYLVEAILDGERWTETFRLTTGRNGVIVHCN